MMNVSPINNNNNKLNFGMALHMPEKQQLLKQFGKEVVEEIEIARPKLKALAKDVDIFVKPSISLDLTRAGEDTLAIEVKKPNEKGSGFFKRVVNSMTNTFNDYIFVDDGNIAENLVNEASRLKAEIK